MFKVILVGGAVAGILGYAWMGRAGANEYEMTPQATYDKLMKAEFKKGGKEAWGTVGADKSGNGSNRITFTGWGECTLDILPEGEAKSALSVTCPNVGEGAAAGMETALRRHALIEWIDSTMTNRPFDQQLALMGTTAGRWPDDVVEHGGLVEAQAEALKMSADMARNNGDSGGGSDRVEKIIDEELAGRRNEAYARPNGAGVDQSRTYGADPSRTSGY